MLRFEIIEHLATLRENTNGTKTIEVNLISFNGNEAKLDIRHWFQDVDGEMKMGKGIALSYNEAKALKDVLAPDIIESMNE